MFLQSIYISTNTLHDIIYITHANTRTFHHPGVICRELR